MANCTKSILTSSIVSSKLLGELKWTYNLPRSRRCCPPQPVARADLPVKLHCVLLPYHPEVGIGDPPPPADYFQDLLGHSRPQSVDGVGMAEPVGVRMSSTLARLASLLRSWHMPFGNRVSPCSDTHRASVRGMGAYLSCR